jgi:hypothetical protein
LIVPIEDITTFEDFYSVLYPIYRTQCVCFRSAGIEYRIAFLSFDISKCTFIIEQLHSQGLIESFVQIDPQELKEKIDGIQFSQPLSISNYIVYPISQGKTTLSKHDKGFQRKMKALGYTSLPNVVYKRENQYKIRFPERFIYQLTQSQQSMS